MSVEIPMVERSAVLCAPMHVEALAVRPARTPVARTGMGPVRSIRSAARLLGRGVLVVGVGGGLGPDVQPGDLVVATEVRGPAGVIPCPGAALLAAELRRLGLSTHLGPIASAPRIVTGAARRTLADSGALAVDTESIWLAPTAGLPFAVIRAIVDTDRAPLLRAGTVARGISALRNLRRAVPAIDAFIAATGLRDGIGPAEDLHFTLPREVS